MINIILMAALFVFSVSNAVFAQSQNSVEEGASTEQSELELPGNDDAGLKNDVSANNLPVIPSPESATPAQQSNTQTSPEVFKPSEEIIEDNAVSFPVDI